MVREIRDQRRASEKASRITEIKPVQFERLARKLKGDFDLDLYAYKPRLVKRRVAARVRKLELSSYAQYLKVIDRDESERERLLSSLNIHVTGFFRNPGLFGFLKDRVLPGVLREKAETGEEFLAVSAGCATGEEPYSISILLRRAFGDELASVPVRIVGIDVDREVIKKARAGRYPEESVAHLPAGLQKAGFRKRGDFFEINGEMRDGVEFIVGDVRDGIPFNDVDLLFCRNLLIYFNREHQLMMVRGIRDSLRPCGHLVLGRTETLIGRLRPGFRVVDYSEHIYKKAGEEPCGWR